MHAHSHQLYHTIAETKLTPHRKPSSDSTDLMEVECMRSCMRKLALWYTPNFRPILTHDDLHHIISTFGFTAVTSTSTTAGWIEYPFSAAGAFLSKSPSPPRPRLPYPRIDGLHVNTYRSFLDAVNFYLRMDNVSDLFHVRGLPLHHAHDRSHKWLRMDKDDLVYVYEREPWTCQQHTRMLIRITILI